MLDIYRAVQESSISKMVKVNETYVICVEYP
jgi:hypothetical protein